MSDHSPTSAMADAYKQMRTDLEGAMEKIPAQEAQFGLLAMINGRPAGLDIVSRSEVYATLHPQLVQSYAMEAIASRRESAKSGDPASGTTNPEDNLLAAKAFLERCAAIKGNSFDSVGLGTDWRFVSDSIVGSGLEVDDTWVHMAYFVDELHEDFGGRSASGKIARMSQRSRYRRL
jgi:hypothetical protein